MSQSAWLSVHTSWLIERLGEPNGPPLELVTAWTAHAWDAASDHCETWLHQVESTLSALTCSDDERRVFESWLPAIESMRAAALDMTADVEARKARRRSRAQSLMETLQRDTDWVFRYGVHDGGKVTMPFFENNFPNAVASIVNVFVAAATYGIDLSLSAAELATGEFLP